MDFTHTYCSTRRDLEETSWLLVSKLASVSGYLLKLVGSKNPLAFAATKLECTDLRERIDTARTALEQHRSGHGC